MRLQWTSYLFLAALFAGCSHGAPNDAATAPPSVAAGTTASAPVDATPTTSAAPPSADATPTPDPNLLSNANGTVVRSFSPGLSGDPDAFAADGADVNEGATGPLSVVWELPGIADVQRAHLELAGFESGKPPVSVTIAGSTTGPQSGFSDFASTKATEQSASPDVNLRGKARWIRLTIDRGGSTRPFSGISIIGTLEPRPANAPPVATQFVELENNPYKDGAFVADAPKDPYYVHLAQTGTGWSAVRCTDTRYGDPALGTFDGRTWVIADSRTTGRAVVNDEGTMIVGVAGGAIHFVATSTTPKYCAPQSVGNGKRNILVLDSDSLAEQYGLDPKDAGPYHFSRIHASALTNDLLARNDALIFNMVCVSDEYLTREQGEAINRWVSSGHVAIIWDSDSCGSHTHYSFLPYQFETNNPGAAGAHGKRLIEVESNDLGSLDPNDKAHYFDAKAYAANENNQIGDANTTVTKDDHWCGHLFGTNSNNVNGFMQLYAPYGSGFYVFDGFDHDDSALPEHQRMRTLEMQLAVPADLPCRVKADQPFVLQPDREGAFVAGVAKTLPFEMEVLANQGWKGHVTVAASGSFPATISPVEFDMHGGTQPLKINVSIPKTAKPGQYAITVVASSGAAKSQAVVSLNATAPPKVIFKQKRIRLYGIHFDYDSAHIQPRSEPVIKQIADMMNQDKSLRFQVEGHTDGDGGAAYNLNLSQKRAESVVNDLVTRYHIARSRLVPKGFGLTRPVASNASEGGKALNRRVELARL